MIEEIFTKRLRLTPFDSHHLTQTYVNWLNDQVIMQYSEQRFQTHSLASCREYWQSYKDSPHHFWAIELTERDNWHIGNIQTYIDEPNQLAGVSILIGERNFHGKRYGEEAFRGVCKFLFEKRKIRKIAAGTMAVNAPMLKLMERLGMLDDGVRRAHYLYCGQPVDIVYKALFQNTYEQLEDKHKAFYK